MHISFHGKGSLGTKREMANLSGRSGPNRDEKDHGNRLKYAFDGGFLSGAHPPDTPLTVDVDDEDSSIPQSSESESSDSVGESKRFSDLAASIQVFSGSLLRMELAEIEMLKAREALRVEAERRRVELEDEMTQMFLSTQLQMASFLARESRNRKRKRVEEEISSSSERVDLVVMSTYKQKSLRTRSFETHQKDAPGFLISTLVSHQDEDLGVSAMPEKEANFI
ncbi:hypothetical protein HHK36_002144 [Tetracentron sinense]|uniref:Uncharacterized protein n=1 Tax=Tetracentron sinense TaxID=13715 RepID=A0A834ZYQ3_TETSI|nr:hypothetical protein HHK36_002144 [Tetracentron sinense]